MTIFPCDHLSNEPRIAPETECQKQSRHYQTIHAKSCGASTDPDLQYQGLDVVAGNVNLRKNEQLTMQIQQVSAVATSAPSYDRIHTMSGGQGPPAMCDPLVTFQCFKGITQNTIHSPSATMTSPPLHIVANRGDNVGSFLQHRIVDNRANYLPVPIPANTMQMQNPVPLNPLLPAPTTSGAGNVASSMRPLPSIILTNEVKHRRGRWTSEEESYAKVLIEEFENGTVEDCEDGCTLRSFLSRKLHCAPMRISKKFAGKSIGKMVFLAKRRRPSPSRSKVHVDDVRLSSQKKLNYLEQTFYESLFRQQEEQSNSVIAADLANIVAAATAPKTSIFSNANARQLHRACLPMFPHGTGYRQQYSLTRPTGSSHASKKSSERQPPFASPYGNPEAYVSAGKGMTSNFSACNQVVVSGDISLKPTNTHESLSQRRSQQCTNAAAVPLPGVGRASGMQGIDARGVLCQGDSSVACSAPRDFDPSAAVAASSSSGCNQVAPDILAGFDGVLPFPAAFSVPAVSDSVDTNGLLRKDSWSIPLTLSCKFTRSFDELHKYLGRDLPDDAASSDGRNDNNIGNTPRASLSQCGPATNALQQQLFCGSSDEALARQHLIQGQQACQQKQPQPEIVCSSELSVFSVHLQSSLRGASRSFTPMHMNHGLQLRNEGDSLEKKGAKTPALHANNWDAVCGPKLYSCGEQMDEHGGDFETRIERNLLTSDALAKSENLDLYASDMFRCSPTSSGNSSCTAAVVSGSDQGGSGGSDNGIEECEYFDRLAFGCRFENGDNFSHSDLESDASDFSVDAPRKRKRIKPTPSKDYNPFC